MASLSPLEWACVCQVGLEQKTFEYSKEWKVYKFCIQGQSWYLAGQRTMESDWTRRLLNLNKSGKRKFGDYLALLPGCWGGGKSQCAWRQIIRRRAAIGNSRSSRSSWLTWMKANDGSWEGGGGFVGADDADGGLLRSYKWKHNRQQLKQIRSEHCYDCLCLFTFGWVSNCLSAGLCEQVVRIG